jgi:hypothetical protein
MIRYFLIIIVHMNDFSHSFFVLISELLLRQFFFFEWLVYIVLDKIIRTDKCLDNRFHKIESIF